MLITRDATISPCGQFRWWLSRSCAGGFGFGYVLWVMLNPSTADANIDDPTIGRCISFSERWGFDGLYVVNAYAFRTFSPAALKGAGYPVGDATDRNIKRLAHGAALIVAAWGTHIQPSRAATVMQILHDTGKPVHALSLTMSGAPGHPLYLPGDSPLIELAA